MQNLSFNKLNNYGKHTADKGNSMLPIQMGKVKSLAILDSGAGVSIATKAMWFKWGQLSLQKTRMELLLTISLVNDILARLQQEHEAMQSDGKARRPTSSMNVCHEEQA